MDARNFKGQIDIGILTIRDDEFNAVLQRFPRHKEVLGRRRYNLSKVETLQGDAYSVAVARCVEEGNGEAQDATRDMIDDLDPSWIILVGIAGGAPADEFSLGDVIVSTRVYDFTVEAVLSDGFREFSSAGGPMPKSITTLAANLQAMKSELGQWNATESIGISMPPVDLSFKNFFGTKSWKADVQQKLKRRFLGPVRQPRVLPGAIASSDRLVKNDELLKLWQRFARKVVGIEMELAGAYRAARNTETPVFTIRGISDIVGFKRDPEWTTYACHTAAAFTLSLIRARPIEPRKTIGNVFSTTQATVPGLKPSPATTLEVVSKVADELKSGLKSPHDVFTPRNPHVNESMYIDRPDLERGLLNAIKGSQHVLVHGESGTGKSWLYKRVLNKERIELAIANLANASRLGTISAELENVVNAVSRSTDNPALSDPRLEPLERCLRALRAQAGERPCCLVLDNLETIFGNLRVMAELGEIIILLDDERYAQYRIKLMVVGVPGGVRDYFSKTQNRATVGNRLRELPEVSRLTNEQVSRLVRRGFIDELKYNVDDATFESVVRHVNWITTGIPQRVHEYCLELAILCEDTRVLDEAMQEEADRIWLRSSLASTYTAIDAYMNERDTKVGRRNQVLYALGHIQRDNFRPTEVEDILRSEFMESTSGKKLNVSGLLSDLGSGTDPLIRRSPKGDTYQFVDPRFRMCLRAMLRKIGDKVDKLDMGNV